MSFGLKPFASSIIGKVRDHNEDAVLTLHWDDVSRSLLGLTALMAVADGMGGHHAGEWASNNALKLLNEYIILVDQNSPVEIVLHDAIVAVNKKLFNSSDASGASRPGTTLTVLAVKGNRCIIAHVGDSRAYLLRASKLRQVTEDDSWAAELVRQGQMTPEAAKNWTHKNQLTKAVGIREDVEPQIISFELNPSDVLLVCSDGLHGMINDENIKSILLSVQSPVQAGEVLCFAANDAGGEDNISVALMSIGNWPLKTNNPSTSKEYLITPPPIKSELSNNKQIINKPHPFHNIKISKIMFYSAIILIAFLLGAGIRFMQPDKSQQKDQEVYLSSKDTLSNQQSNSSTQYLNNENKMYKTSISINQDDRDLTISIQDANIDYLPVVGKYNKSWSKGKYRFNKDSSIKKIASGSSILFIRSIGIDDDKPLSANEELIWNEMLPLGEYSLYYDKNQIAHFKILNKQNEEQ